MSGSLLAYLPDVENLLQPSGCRSEDDVSKCATGHLRLCECM